MTKTAFEFNDHLFPLPARPGLHSKEGIRWRRTITKTLVMKLAIFLLTASLFQAHGNLLAQKVTISGKSITLKQIFNAIEKQTDFVVFSSEDHLRNTKAVSVTVHEVSVSELLDLVLKDQPLAYTIRNKTIFLGPKPAVVPEAISTFLNPVVLLSIEGYLRNEDGEVLSGASIRIKQGGSGMMSDPAGRFSLKTNEGSPQLQISMVGYEMVELTLKKTGGVYEIAKSKGGLVTSNANTTDAITITVLMKKAMSVLEETQITAYGKTTRRLATGNSTTIKSTEIEKQPMFNALEALAGRVPGVSIQRLSGNLAAPVEVVIRGRNSLTLNANNDPLYVVDGLPLSSVNISMFGHSNTSTSMGPVQAGFTHMRGESPLNRINPLDIESITVLKDADATAIYGSRGANGVILITTKKGKSGPPTFTIQLRNGITSAQRFPKLLNTKQYLAVRREAFQNDGIVPDRQNAIDLLYWDSTRNKDWQRELIGTGIMNEINASVSGGSGQTSYRLGVSHSSVTTLLNDQGRNKRLTFNSSFSYSSVNNKFNFSAISVLASSDVNETAISDPSNLPPNAPEIYNERGDFNWDAYRTATNPFGGIDQFFQAIKRPSNSKTLSAQAGMRIGYKVLDGLTIGLDGNYAFDMNDNVKKDPEISIDPLFFSISRAYYGSSRTKNWMMSPKIQYETFIGQGNLSAQLIGEYQSRTVKGETILAFGFPNDDMMKSYNNAMAAQPVDSYIEDKNLKFTAIINYNWNNKYILNISGTRDGSPHFGKRKQFGNFGSAGLAWNAHDEKWMRSVLPTWVSSVKLRGSFGITGGSSIPPYQYLSHWSKNVADLNPQTLFQYNGNNAFHVIRPLNQEFHWVSTRKWETGIDIGLLQNRINVAANVYLHNSTDQLDQVTIARMTGFDQAFSNIPAHLRNKGFELAIDANALRTKDWNLQVNFNFGMNRNKLVDYPNLETSSNRGRLKVGYSSTTVYVLRYTGIDPMTGSYTFEDRNKDGRITALSNNFPDQDHDDRYIPIETMERFSGGFGFSLNYKRFSLSSTFDYVKKQRRDPYLSLAVGGRHNLPVPNEVLTNHWKQPGDMVKYPRFTTMSGELGPLHISDGAFVDGSYLRFNNVNISWNLPQSWISKLKIKNASIAVATSNLLTFSSFRGLDPIVDGPLSPQPIPRVISSQLMINF